jgi:glutathione S-transferase
MPEKLVLYDAHGSPCARRVRIVLLEKGLAWETRLLDLTKLEQKSPAYLALNPNGIVPTLVHGERVVYESNVITEYLDECFPGERLYPADPWERARARMWQAFELEMAKEFRPLMYQRVIGPLQRRRSKQELLDDVRRSTQDPAHTAWASRVYDDAVLPPGEAARLEALLRHRLAHLEHALAGRRFLVGERFTIAEISVLPRVAMFPWIGIPVEAAQHPNLRSWLDANESRPSFVKSRQAAAP